MPMPDRDLITESRQLVASIPEGIGTLRSLDATRLARARMLLGDLAGALEQARVRIAELEQRPAIATVEDLDALPVGTVILDVDLADDPDDPAILVSQKTWASSRWPSPASTGWRKVGSVDVVSAAQLASSDAARFYVLWPRDVGPCDTAGLRGLPLGYLPVMEWHDGWAIRGQVTDWATAAETSRREAGTAQEFRHVVVELREVRDRG